MVRRGDDEVCCKLFSHIDLDKRVRADHPLRVIREIANAALIERKASVFQQPARVSDATDRSPQFASQPRALSELVSAVQSRDARTYGEVIARFGLGPYYLQVCAWVCSGTCSEFCICLCPPPGLLPEFTAIAVNQYKTQVDSAAGDRAHYRRHAGLLQQFAAQWHPLPNIRRAAA
jgi:hypothetical protein